MIRQPVLQKFHHIPRDALTAARKFSVQFCDFLDKLTMLRLVVGEVRVLDKLGQNFTNDPGQLPQSPHSVHYSTL